MHDVKRSSSWFKRAPKDLTKGFHGRPLWGFSSSFLPATAMTTTTTTTAPPPPPPPPTPPPPPPPAPAPAPAPTTATTTTTTTSRSTSTSIWHVDSEVRSCSSG